MAPMRAPGRRTAASNSWSPGNTLVRTADAIWAVIVSAAMTACYPIWLGNELDNRVNALENASRETRAELDERSLSLEERLDKLEDTLGNLVKSATRTTAEVAAATDELLRDVQHFRGKLEEMNYQFEDVSRRFDELERRIAALGGEEALRRIETERAVGKIDRPKEKEAFFALAKDHFDRKQYEAARILFEEFIANPKWRFDDRAPEAQILIGDTHFEERSYRAAILAYQKARETWPTSRFLPDALLKLGLSFDKLGMEKEAVAFLEEAAKFSGQEAGKAARAKLTEIKGR